MISLINIWEGPLVEVAPSDLVVCHQEQATPFLIPNSNAPQNGNA